MQNLECLHEPARQIVSNTLEYLAQSLPKEYVYHCVGHTQNVVEEALRYAMHDQCSERQLTLIAIAAVFHDAGYVEQYHHNEAIGAGMAREAMLQAGGFSEVEIAEVEKMILSTAFDANLPVPQRTLLCDSAKYLVDADLATFGREDFHENLSRMLAEINAKTPEQQAGFYQFTQQIMAHHEFFTEYAMQHYQQKKQQSVQCVIELSEKG